MSVFRHKSLVFQTDADRFAYTKLYFMNEEIKYLNLCGRLMNGLGIDVNYADVVEADNILYEDFGMSSEDILESFKCNSHN